MVPGGPHVGVVGIVGGGGVICSPRACSRVRWVWRRGCQVVPVLLVYRGLSQVWLGLGGLGACGWDVVAGQIWLLVEGGGGLVVGWVVGWSPWWVVWPSQVEVVLVYGGLWAGGVWWWAVVVVLGVVVVGVVLGMLLVLLVGPLVVMEVVELVWSVVL